VGRPPRRAARPPAPPPGSGRAVGGIAGRGGRVAGPAVGQTARTPGGCARRPGAGRPPGLRPRAGPRPHAGNRHAAASRSAAPGGPPGSAACVAVRQAPAQAGARGFGAGADGDAGRGGADNDAGRGGACRRSLRAGEPVGQGARTVRSLTPAVSGRLGASVSFPALLCRTASSSAPKTGIEHRSAPGPAGREHRGLVRPAAALTGLAVLFPGRQAGGAPAEVDVDSPDEEAVDVVRPATGAPRWPSPRHRLVCHCHELTGERRRLRGVPRCSPPTAGAAHLARRSIRPPVHAAATPLPCTRLRPPSVDHAGVDNVGP
jgi:hypothetical protein